MFDNLKTRDFTIIAVAMDSDIEAARPWVAEASPTYTTLIDQEHLLSSLYNMVNVPQAVWIDEHGRVVRPTETGGSLDILREFDLELGGFKPEATARAQAAKTAYVEAVRDWAEHGADSPYLFTPDEAARAVPEITGSAMEAHAIFRLGHYLVSQGQAEEAEQWFARCRELHPDSWNIYRQTTEKMDTGIAAGEGFWNKVMGLGEKAYYAPINMRDMPD